MDQPRSGVSLLKALVIALGAVIVVLLANFMLDRDDAKKVDDQNTVLAEINENQKETSELEQKLLYELEAHRIRQEKVHFFQNCLLSIPIEERTDDVILNCSELARKHKIPDGPDGGFFPGDLGGHTSDTNPGDDKDPARSRPRPTPKPDPTVPPTTPPTEPPLLCGPIVGCIDDPLPPIGVWL